MISETVAFVLVAGAALANANGCPSGYESHNPGGRCFGFNPDLLTYEEAAAACRAEGARLAEPSCPAVQDALEYFGSTCNTGSDFWIGIHYADRKCFVYESTGSRIDGAVSFWDWNQPDNYRGQNNEFSNQDCVRMVSSGKWDDIACDYPARSFCELPAPVSTSVVVTSSPVYQDSASLYGPAFGIVGDPSVDDDEGVFISAYAALPFWQVDFGAPLEVASVRLSNRVNEWADQFNHYSVHVGDEEEVTGEVSANAVCATFEGRLGLGESHMFTCDAPITGRFVSVKMSGAGYLVFHSAMVNGGAVEMQLQ